MPRFFVLAFLLLLAVPPASAREQSDAPDAEIIGFSADGRYFAFEQFGYDSVSDSLSAAIFVVDRATNRQADGFPFGVVPEARCATTPGRLPRNTSGVRFRRRLAAVACARHRARHWGGRHS